MTTRHRVHAVLGWYFAMSYAATPDDVWSTLAAITVGTFGVVLVGWACYDAGRSARMQDDR